MLSCRREGGDMGTSGAIWDDCSALDRLRSRPPRVMLASLANSRARVAAAAASYHITIDEYHELCQI